jgi:hypothetical protein
MVDSGGMVAPADRWSLMALAVSVVAVAHLWVSVQALHYSDFVMFHTTVRALLHGRPAYEPHALADGLWWNMNPPQFHLLIIPLAPLSLPAAAQVFRVVNALAMIAAVLLTFSVAELKSRRAAWLIVAGLLSPAVAMELGAGQVAGLLALAAVAAWRGLNSNRPIAVGLAIGCICAFKPIFLPLVAWLLFTRQWEAAGAAIATGLALIAASVVVWGMAPQIEWLRALGQVTWFDSRFNASWSVLPQRALQGNRVLTYQRLAAASLALGLLVGLWAARLRPADGLAKCLVGSIAFAPLGWIYYLPVAGPLLMRRAFDGAPWPWLAWALWLPLPLVPDVDVPFLLRITLTSAYAWGMLALALHRGSSDNSGNVRLSRASR